MAFNLDGMGVAVFGWLSTLWFWVIIILIIAGVGILVLWAKRELNYRFPCLEVVSLGQGKVSTLMTKAGWFKKRRSFFGLLQHGGEQELVCKSGMRKVFNVSSTDYHEINGKRGLICKRKDDDPEVLVPIDKVGVENLQLLFRIAPADYRDAAVDILETKRRETMTWLEKNAPLIMTLSIFMFGIIALIIIFNFAKGESAAWRTYAMSVKAAVSTVASSSAP